MDFIVWLQGTPHDAVTHAHGKGATTATIQYHLTVTQLPLPKVSAVTTHSLGETSEYDAR